GQEEVYVGSADWMERNFDRRVETIFPIEDVAIRERILGILRVNLADNCRARELAADGTYHRCTPGDAPPIDSQDLLISGNLSAVEATGISLRPPGVAAQAPVGLRPLSGAPRGVRRRAARSHKRSLMPVYMPPTQDSGT